MKGIFHYSILLTRGLTLPKKTTLMGLLLFIPLFVLTYSVVNELNSDIARTSKERIGIEYISELRKLLEQLPKYRGLVYNKGWGHEEFVEKSKIQIDLVNQVIRDIDDVNWRIGKQLLISEHWTRFKVKWKRLESDKDLSQPENLFNEYSQLIDELLALMKLVGDSSGLILDSHLDSHYLMDLMVRQLPALINTAQISRGLSVNQDAAKQEKIMFDKMELIGLLHDEQTNLIITTGKIIQENPHLRDKLDSLLEDALNRLSKFNQELKAPDSGLSVEEKFALGTDTIKSLFLLYDNVSSALDRILKDEIDSYINSRNWIIVSIGLCLLFVLYLITGFYLALIQDIHTLRQAMKNVSSGNLDEEVEIISRDELKNVADGFNIMLRALNESKSEVEETKDKLEVLSKLDALTELPNRRYLEEVLENEWRRASRTKTALAVFMLDIDYFKLYNDYYGHIEGDECIKQVASTLMATVNRSGDFVARYGGEEFMVIVPNCSDDGVNKIATRILNSIHNLQIEHCRSEISNNLTVSIGVAISTPEDGISNSGQLVQQADDALYKAKDAGRNRFVVYTDEDSKTKTVKLIK